MANTSGQQTLDATDEYVSFGPTGPFTVSFAGAWTGTITLRKSYDGTNWMTVKTYTSNPDPPTELVNAVSGACTFQLYATLISSGSATVEMGDA